MARTRKRVNTKHKDTKSTTETNEFTTNKEYNYVDEKLDKLLSEKFTYFEKYRGDKLTDGIHYYNGVVQDLLLILKF